MKKSLLHLSGHGKTGEGDSDVKILRVGKPITGKKPKEFHVGESGGGMPGICGKKPFCNMKGVRQDRLCRNVYHPKYPLGVFSLWPGGGNP